MHDWTSAVDIRPQAARCPAAGHNSSKPAAGGHKRQLEAPPSSRWLQASPASSGRAPVPCPSAACALSCSALLALTQQQQQQQQQEPQVAASGWTPAGQALSHWRASWRVSTGLCCVQVTLFSPLELEVQFGLTARAPPWQGQMVLIGCLLCAASPPNQRQVAAT